MVGELLAGIDAAAIQAALVEGMVAALAAGVVRSGGRVAGVFTQENLMIGALFAVVRLLLGAFAPGLVSGFQLGLGARAAGLG